MSERTVTHATFTLERRYDAPPGRVFAAFADPVAKARWFGTAEGWETTGHDLDFRVGGSESNAATPPGGIPHRYDALYLDIVPERRIVLSYEMHLGDTRISVSLATVELSPGGGGTLLRFTEQGAFLDGYDDVGQRQAGTENLLDALGAELGRAA